MAAKFKLELKCDNDAFVDDPGEELHRILRDIADKVMDPANLIGEWMNVRDINGNHAGYWRFYKPRGPKGRK